MQLPLIDVAVVPAAKITGYLLSEAHPDGRSKATFFRRLGFGRDRPDVLQAALLRAARNADMAESAFAYGLKYVGVGMLPCPGARLVRVVTVWVLRDGQPPPYFLTAYPA